MDQERLIETAWLSYRDRVIPREASVTQVTESRRCFYAGALSLLSTMLVIMDSDREPTAADLRKMNSIQAELKRFNDKVAGGLA